MTKHDLVLDTVDTIEAIAGDLQILQEGAMELVDYDECGDPINIDTLNKMKNFAQSVQELAASLLNNINNLMP